MPDVENDAEQLARACADAMWSSDAASQGLGMEIIDVRVGSAQLRMKVRPDMVNGHNICHGGFIFTLADSTFAFSCNTYNERTVAASCDISFVQAAHLGDELTATGKETYRKGRNGIYDISVENQNGEIIAHMRGKSRTIGGIIAEV